MRVKRENAIGKRRCSRLRKKLKWGKAYNLIQKTWITTLRG